MFSTLVTAALIASTAISGVLADINIDAIELTQCGNVQIRWGDGGEPQGPYSVLLLNPQDPCGDPIADLGADHYGSSMRWNVSIPAGTNTQFYVENEADEGWSGTMEIQQSSDFNCLPESLRPASSSSVAPSSSSASVSATGTTLVVSPTKVSSALPSSSSIAPVGAAGADPFSGSNGALSSVQFNAPVLALSAIAAAYALL